jgi:hypothetical protein
MMVMMVVVVMMAMSAPPPAMMMVMMMPLRGLGPGNRLFGEPRIIFLQHSHRIRDRFEKIPIARDRRLCAF